jgi:hypothetical protein
MKTISAICQRADRALKAVSSIMLPAIYLLVGGNAVLLALFYVENDYRAGGIDAISGFIVTFGFLILILFCWDRRYDLFCKILLCISVVLLVSTAVARVAGLFDHNAFAYESCADGVMLVLGIYLIGAYLLIRRLRLC